jgi:hypothetical protein
MMSRQRKELIISVSRSLQGRWRDIFFKLTIMKNKLLLSLLIFVFIIICIVITAITSLLIVAFIKIIIDIILILIIIIILRNTIQLIYNIFKHG